MGVLRQTLPRLCVGAGSAALASRGSLDTLLRLSGGDTTINPAMKIVDTDQSSQAYDWCVNIATAATLVAGASLASLLDDHGLHVDLISPSGAPRVFWHHLRMLSTVLLATAFAFEICAVFAATVTGTVLLSRGIGMTRFDPRGISAMHLVHRRFEFEYCLIRAGFFQGLLNWLCAIGMRFWVTLMTPSDDDESLPEHTRHALSRKRFLLGSGLALTMFSLVLMMLAFYNYHLNFYDNYGSMLVRLGRLTWSRYFRQEPRRVLPITAAVLLAVASAALFLAFQQPMVSAEMAASDSPTDPPPIDQP